MMEKQGKKFLERGGLRGRKLFFQKGFLPLLALGVACFIAYGNILRAEFVFDDYLLVVENESIRDLSNLPRFLYSAEAFASSDDFFIYRPLATATFAINYALGGLDPFGYHLLNVLLHWVNASLIFLIFPFFFGGRKIYSFLCALLFALHPLQTEAITWVSGRGNGLFLFLVLLSFASFIKFCHGERKKFFFYGLSLFLYFLALLSKEMAITLPLMLMAYGMGFLGWAPSKDLWKAAKLIGPFFLMAGLYFSLRYLVVGQFGQREPLWVGRWATVKLMMEGLAIYMRLCFFPINQSLLYVFLPPGPLYEPRSLLPLCVLLLCLAFLLYSYKQWKEAFFCTWWFFAGLLPVLNIVPIRAIIDERFLYLSTVGFCLLLSHGLYKIVGSLKPDSLGKRLFTASVVMMLLFMGILTIRRNSEWKSSFSLWLKTVETAPLSHAAHYNLGISYKKRGMREQAMEEFKRSIMIKPDFPDAYAALGHILSEMGMDSEALIQYKRSVMVSPTAKALNNLGVLYGLKGREDEAIEQFRAALEADQSFVSARMNLAKLLTKKGLFQQAIKEYEKLLEMKPDFAPGYNLMGTVYALQGLKDKARWCFEKALSLDPNLSAARENLRRLNAGEGKSPTIQKL